MSHYKPESEICRFTSFEQWVNKAASWLGGVSSCGHRHKQTVRAICVDAKGRVCRIGADFMRARDEDAFPVVAYRKGGAS